MAKYQGYLYNIFEYRFGICLCSMLGESGTIWSENCIFPYDEVNTYITVFFLHSATSIIIFLTYSIVLLLENDIFV